MEGIGKLEGRDFIVSAFFVADHAEAVGGKLYVNGACWDTLSVAELPAQHPHMSVATALHVPWQSETQTHNIQVRLVDQDMQDVVPALQGQFGSTHPPETGPGDMTTLVLAFNLVNISFSKPGPHTFMLSVDGTELARARFKLAIRD